MNIIIQEFLPNPAGKDADGETITLRNAGKETAHLNGWRIQNAAGKSVQLDGRTLEPGETLTLPYRTTKLALRNNGETLSLYDVNGNLVDELGYTGSAVEGRVIRHENTVTPELRAMLFDPLAKDSITAETNISFSGSFMVTLLVTGILFASLAVFLLKKHEKTV